MGTQLRHWRSILALLAALSLSACGGGAQYPLLAPIEKAGSHGYSEKSLGGDRYAVTYLGPARLSSSAPAARERDVEAARSQALDLAMWRAALIAQGAGFAGFRITDQRSTVEISAQPVYYDQQFYGPFGSGVGPGGIIRPASVGTNAPQSYPETPYNRLQGRASLEVELLRSPGPNDLTAGEVVQRLRIKYPDAEKS